MEPNKINGLVAIQNGKIMLNSVLTNEGKNIRTDIEKLLALRDIIENNLIGHEKDVQRSFIPKNKSESGKQIDLESMIAEVTKDEIKTNK